MEISASPKETEGESGASTSNSLLPCFVVVLLGGGGGRGATDSITDMLILTGLCLTLSHLRVKKSQADNPQHSRRYENFINLL